MFYLINFSEFDFIRWLYIPTSSSKLLDKYLISYPDNFTAVQEAPGKFATGTIVKRYTSGQIIDVTVEITANHYGYFQFKVCPNEDITKDKGQDCFDA